MNKHVQRGETEKEKNNDFARVCGNYMMKMKVKTRVKIYCFQKAAFQVGFHCLNQNISKKEHEQLLRLKLHA